MNAAYSPPKSSISLPIAITGSVIIPLSMIFTVFYFAANIKASVETHEKSLTCLEKKINDSDIANNNQEIRITRLTVMLENISSDIVEIKQNTRSLKGIKP